LGTLRHDCLGLWFEGAFCFGTGSNTQKARNLAKNPVAEDKV
jgi:hypothetical protein